jgi:hypothetical protein
MPPSAVESTDDASAQLPWPTVQAYPRRMSFVTALAAVIALVVGVPLVIVGLALAGPAGWIVAAVVLPLATLAVILWLGRPQPGDGEPPGGRG